VPDKVLRIGILGAARIAGRALIEPAREVPSATVAAVAARGKARADAFALQHGIPAAYGSYEELLDDPAIDAVYIPLPNALHARWTVRAIEAGKHVLCEKPFTSNAAEAEEVRQASDRSGLIVMEAMHYRYHPLARRMAALIADGAIGAPRHVQCWTCWPVSDPDDIRYSYDMAGGALMDGGCYAIDCLDLVGLSGPTVTGALAVPVGDTGADADVDRTMAARVTSPRGGLTGWFESAFTHGGEFRADVYVTGDGGSLWLRNFVLAHEGSLSLFPNDAGDSPAAVPAREDAAPGDGGLGNEGLDADGMERGAGATTFAYQLRAFTAAVCDGVPFDTTVAHALSTMRVIDDTYRAAGLPPRGSAAK
jgi:predicted dehydrogenase